MTQCRLKRRAAITNVLRRACACESLYYMVGPDNADEAIIRLAEVNRAIRLEDQSSGRRKLRVCRKASIATECSYSHHGSDVSRRKRVQGWRQIEKLGVSIRTIAAELDGSDAVVALGR